MMPTNNISIIIPAYNAERTILRTLISLEQQTKRDYIQEVLVVDDGSTDKTVELILSYCINSNLNIIVLCKANGGVSSARNYGIKHAKGDWIAFCDADDEWFKDKLEYQIKILNNNPNIDLLGGNWTGKPISIFGKKIDGLYSPSIEQLCIKMFPQMSTIIVRKNVFDIIKGFDETMECGEDGRFLFQVKIHFGYYYDSKQIICFDGGKRGFGASGLSSKLKSMHIGWKKNLKYLRKEKQISTLFYFFASYYERMKYLRRIILSRIMK